MPFDAATESRRSLARRLALFAAARGFTRQGDIPDDMTFIQWVEKLAEGGLKVDRKPFTLADRPALVPIYAAIPTTRAEAAGKTLVVMKATQLGLTVWEVLADLYMALKFGPVNIGMFLPDQSTAAFKSEQRFMPILRSAPSLYEKLIQRTELDGSRKKVGEGNVLTRQFADSLMMFLWTSGKVTTESRPMDIISLDEVQEMTLDQIDKVYARMGDSPLRFALMLSTANMPDADIDFWYQQGTQEVWHTRCLRCDAESDLSDPQGIFPAKSTTWNTGQVKNAPRGEFIWTCPACGGWIDNPQIGRYIARNPGAAANGIRSFLLPRTISPRITPREMVTAYARAKTGDQRKSFWNRTLARPYVDPDQIPVTEAHLREAARRGMELGLTWLKSARGTYMGIDQMGGWHAIVIKRRLPDGRQAVVHCEAHHDLNPWARASELMRLYGVAYCVVEQLPNVDGARGFANEKANLGKVFLASYANLKDDMMIWGDDMSRSDRRTAAEDRTRYTVTLNQYKTMQRTLYRLRDAECLWPDPSRLEQDVPVDGVTKRVMLVQDMVWNHYTKTALVVEQDADTRKPKASVKKIALDPHFSYATMLCDVAWSRDAGGTTFLLPDDVPPSGRMDQPGAGRGVTDAAVPDAIRSMLAPPPIPGTCGTCTSFGEGGACQARGLRVAAADPGCFLHVGRR